MICGTNRWKKPPSDVVSADTLHNFEKRLDRFLMNKDIKFQCLDPTPFP